MGLTEAQKTELQRLSIEKEGLIFTGEKAKASPIATMVIGLGEIGRETVNMLKRKRIERIESAGNLGFLAIDTKHKRRKNIEKEEWLSGEEIFEIEAADEDLLSESYACDLENRIKEQIDRILENAQPDAGWMGRTEKDLEVILTAEISEDLSQSALISLSCLIRKIIHEKPVFAKLSAYLYTPDVRAKKYHMGIAESEDILEKGYEILRNIDYYMNFSDDEDTCSIKNYENRYGLKQNIYEACTILTIPAENNKDYDAYERLIDRVTEHLTDCLLDIRFSQFGMSTQLPHLYSEDKRRNLSGWLKYVLKDPKQFPKAANYSYQMIKRSATEFPEKEFLTYCANHLFENVYAQLICQKDVDEKLVTEVMAKAGLTKEEPYFSFARYLKAVNPARMIVIPKEIWPSKQEMKEGKDQVWKKAEEQALKAAEIFESAVFRKAWKNAVIELLEEQMNQLLLTKGPYCVLKVLTGEDTDEKREIDPKEAFYSISDRLLNLRNVILKKAEDLRKPEEEYKKQRNKAAYMEARPAVGSVERYVKLCCKQAWRGIYEDRMYRTLSEILMDVRNELINELAEKYRVYTDTLEMLGVILKKDADVCMKSERGFLNLNENTPGAGNLRYYLESIVSTDIPSKLKKELLQSMYEKRSVGTEMDTRSEIRRVFDLCMRECFGEDREQKFAAAAYSEYPVTIEELDRILSEDENSLRPAFGIAAETIIRALQKQNDSKTLLLPGYSEEWFMAFGVLVYGTKSPLLQREVKGRISEQKNFAISGGNSSYTLSEILCRLPLYVIPVVKKMEEIYRRRQEEDGRSAEEKAESEYGSRPYPYNLDMVVRDEQPYEKSPEYALLLKIKKAADHAMEMGILSPTEIGKESCFVLKPFEQEKESSDRFRKLVREKLMNLEADEEISFYDLLQYPENGFTAGKEIALTAGSLGLDPVDLDGAGRYLEIGDFYKLIRMKPYYMEVLKRSLETLEEAFGIYTEECEDIVYQRQYMQAFRGFVYMLKTGRAGFANKEKTKMYYMFGHKQKELITMDSDSETERKYILYHAFHEFHKLDQEQRKEMYEIAKELLKQDKEVDLGEVNESIDALLNAGESMEAAHMPEQSSRDYTFDRSRLEHRSADEILRSFYERLKKNLKN